MSYIQQTLIKGEQVLLETRIALRAYWFRFLLGVFFIALLFFAPRDAPNTVPGIALAVAVLCVLPPLIRYWTNELAFTNRRVVAKVGLLSLKTIEIHLEKVESVRVDQTVLGRLLGYGTVVIVGTGGSHEAIPNIPNPVQFRMKFSGAIEGIRTPFAVSPSGSAHSMNAQTR